MGSQAAMSRLSLQIRLVAALAVAHLQHHLKHGERT
jgi:hypothetical protein